MPADRGLLTEKRFVDLKPCDTFKLNWAYMKSFKCAHRSQPVKPVVQAALCALALRASRAQVAAFRTQRSRALCLGAVGAGRQAGRRHTVLTRSCLLLWPGPRGRTSPSGASCTSLNI